MPNNVGQTNHIFLENVTGLSDGIELDIISNFSTMLITIEKTGINKIIFEAKSLGEKWQPRIGANTETLDLDTEFEGDNALIEFELSGLTKFRVRVSEYTNGEINVLGRVVL